MNHSARLPCLPVPMCRVTIGDFALKFDFPRVGIHLEMRSSHFLGFKASKASFGGQKPGGVNNQSYSVPYYTRRAEDSSSPLVQHPRIRIHPVLAVLETNLVSFDGGKRACTFDGWRRHVSGQEKSAICTSSGLLRPFRTNYESGYLKWARGT